MQSRSATAHLVRSAGSSTDFADLLLAPQLATGDAADVHWPQSPQTLDDTPASLLCPPPWELGYVLYTNPMQMHNQAFNPSLRLFLAGHNPPAC